MNDEIGNIVIRKLTEQDDLSQAAALIYHTDKYIFPYLFGNDISRGAAVLSRMVRADTIYNYRNITAAVADGRTVGIVVALGRPFTVRLAPMAACFLEAGEIVGERFTKVFNEYYSLMEGEGEGVYIANVCVDGNYRGRGIAGRMLSRVLEDGREYDLETVKGNAPAFALYTAAGFETEYEYPGFTGVPCYKMIRKKRA